MQYDAWPQSVAGDRLESEKLIALAGAIRETRFYKAIRSSPVTRFLFIGPMPRRGAEGYDQFLIHYVSALIIKAEAPAARAVRESLGRLDLEVDRRLVRAPIAGTIAEAAALRPGAFVSAGQTLGVVMPAGRLVLVTRLPPAALGRVAAGQPSSRLILQDRETKRSRSPRGPGG